MDVVSVNSAAASAGTVRPGMRIATAIDVASGTPIEITAGRVLRSGVHDIAKTGNELLYATRRWDPTQPPAVETTWGTVAFVRTGDAWTAVELLVPGTTGRHVLWSPTNVRDARIAPDVQIDALWQISDYGGDYSQFLPKWTAARG